MQVAHYAEGQILRAMVGLLAADGAAMSVVASSLAHGDLFWAAVVDAAAATGQAAYLALRPAKPTSLRTCKSSDCATTREWAILRPRPGRRESSHRIERTFYGKGSSGETPGWSDDH